MPAREPRWWYEDSPGTMARALAPAALIWSWLAARRMTRPASYRSPLPVVCVGNFTAGGTGKTPLAAKIVQLLLRRGERPVVLTRGYGGRERGPHRVVPGMDSSAQVGDEPLLLARLAPVIVARDRAEGARAIEAEAGIAPPTVIVMDDGLQNPTLAKDLIIAVVDGRRGTGNGRIMPAGPLRAPLDLQLALADAIVVNLPREGASPALAEGLRTHFEGPVLEARVEPTDDASALVGQRVLALSGIANPARFHALLRELGADIVAFAEFPDHHAFSDADARSIMARALQVSARILTTEKDLVRLHGGTGAIGELAAIATALPIRLVLSERDESRLEALLDSALIRHRRSRLKP